MIATAESLDELLAEVTRQAARNAAYAGDTAEQYLSRFEAANQNQLAALDSLQQTLLRSAIEVQSVTTLLSRSIVEAAAIFNQAILRITVAIAWPWLVVTSMPAAEFRASAFDPVGVPPQDQVTAIGDAAMSGLRFQGPMGVIASGMGELDG